MSFRKFHRGGRGIKKAPGEMNRLEEKYSKHLELLKLKGEVLSYWFEPWKFNLAPRTTYSPDFLVMKADEILEIHEVKGTSKGRPYVEDDAAVKIKVAAKMYPFKFRMVWWDKTGWRENEY
jgi:hypothetical protein